MVQRKGIGKPTVTTRPVPTGERATTWRMLGSGGGVRIDGRPLAWSCGNRQWKQRSLATNLLLIGVLNGAGIHRDEATV